MEIPPNNLTFAVPKKGRLHSLCLEVRASPLARHPHTCCALTFTAPLPSF